VLRSTLILKLVLVFVVAIVPLKGYVEAPVSIDVTAPPPRDINELHLFKDIRNHIPNDGIIPYDINTPLFSDYAEKHRYLYMPPGKSATYEDDGKISYPVGAALIKTFSFLNDRRDPSLGDRIIETRVLEHRPEGWVGYPYVWNDNLTSARLAVDGARIDVSWTHEDGTGKMIRYAVPNMNECKQCHQRTGVMAPLGPKPLQLNLDLAYDGKKENQLDHWVSAGILQGLPKPGADLPRMPVWNDPASGPLDARARAYLDANCAHCHSPTGEAYSTGLDLSWDQHEPVKYGIDKLPTAAGPATRGYKYAIVPSRPDRSFLISRLRATDPALMMPRNGRSLPHDEGVDLLEEWIAAMDPNLSSETRYGTKQ